MDCNTICSIEVPKNKIRVKGTQCNTKPLFEISTNLKVLIQLSNSNLAKLGPAYKDDAGGNAHNMVYISLLSIWKNFSGLAHLDCMRTWGLG